MFSQNNHGLEIRFSEALKIIKDEVLGDVQIAHQQLTSSRVISSIYKDISFSTSVFSGCYFNEVVFENCTFKNCIFEFSHFKQCMFINCEFIGCSWQGSSTRQSQYINCVLDHALSRLTEDYGNDVQYTLDIEQLDLLSA